MAKPRASFPRGKRRAVTLFFRAAWEAENKVDYEELCHQEFQPKGGADGGIAISIGLERWGTLQKKARKAVLQKFVPLYDKGLKSKTLAIPPLGTILFQ